METSLDTLPYIIKPRMSVKESSLSLSSPSYIVNTNKCYRCHIRTDFVYTDCVYRSAVQTSSFLYVMD